MTKTPIPFRFKKQGMLDRLFFTYEEGQRFEHPWDVFVSLAIEAGGEILLPLYIVLPVVYCVIKIYMWLS